MSQQPCLDVQELDLLPVIHEAGRPIWGQEWIAPGLYDLLFGQAEKGKRENTFLIVDPTLRKRITILFDLDVLDVPAACLFQGQAAQDLAEAAPYIIDLTLPEGHHRETETIPRFHRSFFKDHWNKGTGIILRTTADLATTRAHLRKFTKYQEASGNWYFFRFWDTNISYDYFAQVAQMPSRAKDLFHLKQGDWLSLWVSYNETLQRAHAISPDFRQLQDASYSPFPFQISPVEKDALMRGVLRGFAKDIAREVQADVPDHDERLVEQKVFDCVTRMHGARIYEVAHLVELARYSLAQDHPFDPEHLDATARHILDSPASEAGKMTRLRAHWNAML